MEKNFISKNGNRLIVCESVSYGHPDKIADQIADAILDTYLIKDENTRAGIEVMVKDNTAVLGGEVSSDATVNHEDIVRKVYGSIQFPPSHGLSPSEIKVINLIGKQSAEIHFGVDKEDEIGAGDQGFMVGFASNETENYMPLGHYLATRICDYAARMRGLGPDAKSQVIMEYGKDGRAVGIHSILVSVMHPYIDDVEEVRKKVVLSIIDNHVGIEKGIYDEFIKGKDIKIDVNPCGSWQVGGPISDCGVTGRKLVVDAYGGYCNIGGGASAGKDLSKVDRSGAYMARYLAKNIVASGVCDNCKVTLSYMIGVAQPCSVEIDMNRNEDKAGKIKKWIADNVDLTPKSYIKKFYGDRKAHIFFNTSRCGHYGHNDDVYYPWEKVDLAEELKKYIE